VGVIASVIIGWSAQLGPVYFAGALASGLWMLAQCLDFIKNPTPERAGRSSLTAQIIERLCLGQ